MPLVEPPRTTEPDLDALEALIKEARRRARRRRLAYLGGMLLAGAAAWNAYLVFGGGGVTHAASSGAPPAAQIEPLAAHADADPGRSHGPDGGFVLALAAGPSRLYAATIGSGVFRSADGGRSWQALRAGPAGSTRSRRASTGHTQRSTPAPDWACIAAWTAAVRGAR